MSASFRALVTFLTLVVMAAILVAPFVLARIRPEAKRELSAPATPQSLAFAKRAERGTAEWRAAMRTVGDRMRAHDVAAVVFVHGTFTGDDPLSSTLGS